MVLSITAVLGSENASKVCLLRKALANFVTQPIVENIDNSLWMSEFNNAIDFFGYPVHSPSQEMRGRGESRRHSTEC